MKLPVPKRLYGYLQFLCLFGFTLILTNFNAAYAQPTTDGLNGPIILYDNAEAVPPIAWPTPKTRGYMMVTGGTQVFGDPNSSTNILLVGQGFTNGFSNNPAPAPRAGNKMYRMQVVKRTDLAAQYCRSEVYWGNGNGEITGAEWFACSIYIPSDWVHDSRPIGMGYDFKFPNAQGPASLYLKMENGQWQASRQYPQGSNEVRTSIGAVAKGAWTDFVIHRNFSPNNDGFIEIYINKKMVYSYYGPNYPGGEGYMLHGMYKWQYISEDGQGEGQGSYNGPIIAYYDEIRFGNARATLESMSPNGNAGPSPTPNTPPTVQAGANITITLPSNSVTLNGVSNDPDGNVSDYTWTKVSGPGGGAIQNEDGATTQITGLQAGTYVYRLTVTDNRGATAQDDVTITVNEAAGPPPPPPNAAPLASSGANKTITLPLNTVTLTGTGTDQDGTIADYTWTKVSGPAGGLIADADASTTAITGLQAGTYVFRLTVTDNDGATGADDVQVVVNAAPAPPPNQSPVATAGANQVITLPKNTVTLQGGGTDADGTIADYSWEKVSGPQGGAIANADGASTGISGLTAGTYVFRLTVTDNDGSRDSDDIIVVVNPEPVQTANQPPSAAAGGDMTIRLPINAVTLNGSGADADGQIAGYRWTKVSGPAGGNFQAAGLQSTGYGGLAEGVYVVRLTVTDDDGATDTDDVQITVRAAATTPQPPANEAPAANAGADIRIILPVNGVTLNGVGTDVDGTIASYNWTKVSGPASGTIINPAAQSTGVTGLTAGVYVFRLTISDNDGAKSTDEVEVTVRAAAAPPTNQAPSATAGSDRVITLPVSTVNLRGSAVDADGSVVSYNWKKMSGPAAGTIQAANSQGTSVVDLKEGEYIYRFTVTDDKGAVGSDELKVTVRAAAPLPNRLPVADAGTDITISFPQTGATLNGTNSSDPDGTISGYRWVMVRGPVTGTLSNANSPKATLTDLVEGVYEFELTVIDNDGASAVDRVLVTVTGNNTKPVVIVSDTMTVYLPAQNTQLDASQSYDTDGTIASYQWSKVSGPGNPNLLSPAWGKTIVTDLVAGTYQFSITITDNDGSVSKAFVTVVVKNSTSRRLIPVINLYPNPAETNVTLTIDSEVDGKSEVVFYDILGRPVLKDSFNKTSRTVQRRINISNLSDGVYAVEISIDQAEKVVRKVVKQ